MQEAPSESYWLAEARGGINAMALEGTYWATAGRCPRLARTGGIWLVALTCSAAVVLDGVYWDLALRCPLRRLMLALPACFGLAPSAIMVGPDRCPSCADTVDGSFHRHWRLWPFVS